MGPGAKCGGRGRVERENPHGSWVPQRGRWVEDAAQTQIAMSRSGQCPILRARCRVGRHRELGNQRQDHAGPMALMITRRLREVLQLTSPVLREQRAGICDTSDNCTEFST